MLGRVFRLADGLFFGSARPPLSADFAAHLSLISYGQYTRLSGEQRTLPLPPSPARYCPVDSTLSALHPRCGGDLSEHRSPWAAATKDRKNIFVPDCRMHREFGSSVPIPDKFRSCLVTAAEETAAH
jgi:hypothetical protein